MKGRRFVRILGASALVAITISAVLAFWTARAETFAHYRPEYEQIDLLPILQKDELTEEEYTLLFRQTGLARAGIDELLAAGQQEELLYLQQRYFADPEIECLHYNLFIRSERLVRDKGTGETSALLALSAGAVLSARELEPYFAFSLSKPEPIAARIPAARELSRNDDFLANEPEWNTVLEDTIFMARALRQIITAASQTEEQNRDVASPVSPLEPGTVSPPSASDSCAPFPTVQPGDILITYSGHVFGWRSGHAAMVIDAEGQLTLEAITLGCDSRICSLADWEEYPSVALLRLKDASLQEREQIAAYAKEHLQGLPYSLNAFTIKNDDKAVPSIFSGFLARSISRIVSFETRTQMPGFDQTVETAPSLTGTQCAHLVWYAYRNFGYDLDSDGGFVVTPDDLYHSDLLELVQIYGIPLNY